MKKYIILLLAIISIQTTLNAQWTWQALPNAPVSWRFDDMYFLNPQKGWAINPSYNYLFQNQYGRVFTTNDAGQTWTLLYDSSTTFIRSVGFADDLNGWFGNLGDSTATPDTNFLYQTTDGGSTWQAVTNVTGIKPKGICGISVVNDSIIYAYGRYYGPAVLMKTMDMGQSWITQSLSTQASGLIDGYFFGPDTGFITGTYGSPPKALILSTFDGGVSWQVRHQSLRNHEAVWKIVFPSRNIGYATIQSYLDGVGAYPDTTYFLKTTDGGLTWQEKIFKTNGFYELQGIGFINDSVGWVGGDCCWAFNYKTIDGGNNWFPDNSFGVQAPPYNVYGGYAINRFRKFGDSLMYASGNTIYKLQNTQTGISTSISNADSFITHPNPTRYNFTIRFPEEIKIGSVEVFTVLGERVFAEPIIRNLEKNINVENILSGIYIVKIFDGENVYSKKLIIEHD